MSRRFVNNLLQLKVDGAIRELVGFTLNSTLGIAGLGDVAKAEGAAPPDEEDTGQTLAVYGVSLARISSSRCSRPRRSGTRSGRRSTDSSTL